MITGLRQSAGNEILRSKHVAKYLLAIICVTACLIMSFGCQSGNQVSGLKVLIGATAILQAGGTSPVQDAVDRDMTAPR